MAINANYAGGFCGVLCIERGVWVNIILDLCGVGIMLEFLILAEN